MAGINVDVGLHWWVWSVLYFEVYRGNFLGGIPKINIKSFGIVCIFIVFNGCDL